jgi:hypothetical protein
MPLIWAAAVIAAFTAIYAGAGNVASGQGGATHNLLTALTHSIAAFATVGFNTLEPVGWGARLLTAIEAMFGIGLFALFVSRSATACAARKRLVGSGFSVLGSPLVARRLFPRL